MATDIRAQGVESWTGRDKALHLAAGSTLAAGGYALGALKFEDRGKRIVAGIGLSLGAGAAGVTIAWLIDRLRHPRRTMPVAPVLTGRHAWER